MDRQAGAQGRRALRGEDRGLRALQGLWATHFFSFQRGSGRLTQNLLFVPARVSGEAFSKKSWNDLSLFVLASLGVDSFSVLVNHRSFRTPAVSRVFVCCFLERRMGPLGPPAISAPFSPHFFGWEGVSTKIDGRRNKKKMTALFDLSTGARFFPFLASRVQRRSPSSSI